MRATAKHVVVLLSVVLTLGIAGASRPAPAAAQQPTTGSPPGTERIDLRTTTSRTFQLADGRMVTQLFDKPVFYRDSSSGWQPVDTRLHVPSDRSSALAADRSPSKVALDAAGSSTGFLRLQGMATRSASACPRRSALAAPPRCRNRRTPAATPSTRTS
jgi:hypothetical protein